MYVVKKMGGTANIPKDYATGMVVEKFERALSTGLLPEMKLHYDNQFQVVTV